MSAPASAQGKGRAATARGLVLASVAIIAWALAGAATAAQCELCQNSSSLLHLWNMNVQDQSTTSTSGTGQTEIGHFACYAARVIACDNAVAGTLAGGCWIQKILETVGAAAKTVVTVVPRVLACAQTTPCTTGDLSGPLAIVMIALILLTVTIRAGEAFTKGEPWRGALPTMVTVMLVIAASVALQGDLIKDAWQLTGVALSMGAAMGVELRDVAASGFATPPAGGGIACETLATTTPVGWELLIEILVLLAREALDVVAVMVGIGLSFIPDLSGILATLMKMVKDLFTLKIETLLEIARVVIVVIIVGQGLHLGTRFLLLLLEAVIEMSLAIALLPIAVWMMMWSRTRTVIKYVGTEVLYGAIVLAAAGLLLTVARAVMALGLRGFVSNIENTHWGLLTADAVSRGCYSNWVRGSSRPLDLYGDFSHHLCLLTLGPHEVSINGADVTVYGSYLVGSITEGIGQWLPAVIMLVAAAAIATAIVGYAKVAAVELTGRQSSSGVAEVVASDAQGAGARVRKMLS